MFFPLVAKIYLEKKGSKMYIVRVLHGARACVIEVDVMFSELWMPANAQGSKLDKSGNFSHCGCISQKTNSGSHLKKWAVCGR